MGDSNLQLHWTDDQWNRVHQVVYEEARKARVAGNFLPLYGPLEPDATNVAKEELTYEAPKLAGELQRISVNNTETQPLMTLEILVYLRGAQVADPELSSALTAFRRAANVLARLEDAIIFNGGTSNEQIRNEEEAQKKEAEEEDKLANEKRGGDSKEKNERLIKLRQTHSKRRNTKNRRAAGSALLLPRIFSITGADGADGLIDKADDLMSKPKETDPGKALVAYVSSAIAQLEAKGHLGPFACILDQELFLTAQTPSNDSMVLPQDRILPFLGGGSLVRSSVLLPYTGMVVASGGAPIDLVVATDISVKFLQVTLEPRFVFRVYEKIALRIKQDHAIVSL